MPASRTDRGRALRLLPVVVGVVVVAVDQLTKTWALDHAVEPRHVVGSVTLQLTFNSGAAFGLGRGVTPVIEALVVVLIIGIAVFGRRASRRLTPAGAVGLGLLMGGAVGNLIDRIIRHHDGAVIDFIAALRIGHRDLWPVFNVADAAIVIGAFTLAVVYARSRPHPRSS